MSLAAIVAMSFAFCTDSSRIWLRIGQHIVLSRTLAFIALVSVLATIAGAPFWIALAARGGHRLWLAISVAAAAVELALAVVVGGVLAGWALLS